MKTNFKLLRDLVMILQVNQTAKSNTLLVIGSDKTAPKQGIVLSVGPGTLQSDGTYIPIEYSQGDFVVFTLTNNKEMKIGDDILQIVPESQILCKLV